MIDPASAADWVQASLVAGLLASLAAGGLWALGLERRQERSPGPGPSTTTEALALERVRGGARGPC
jgi:hypothetical protein